MKNFLEQLKGKLSRKSAVVIPDGSPTLLIVGSMRDCSAKDAMAFARGLAEKHVIAPELGMVRVVEDRPNGRFVYEIHEGGPGHSIIDGVLAALRDKRPVNISLVNQAYVAVEEEGGELFSLVYPGRDNTMRAYGSEEALEVVVNPEPIQKFCDENLLLELFPQHKALPRAGFAALSLAAAVFMMTGAVFVVTKSGVLEPDVLFKQTKAGQLAKWEDNPAWQLEKARAEATAKGKGLKQLKKDSKGWSWELTQ